MMRESHECLTLRTPEGTTRIVRTYLTAHRDLQFLDESGNVLCERFAVPNSEVIKVIRFHRKELGL